MDIEQAFAISASALDAQRSRLNVISSNLANVQSTRTPKGGPYKRKDVVFSSTPIQGTFNDALSASKVTQAFQGVQVSDVQLDPRPLREAYEPHHPDANVEGIVLYPNVNMMEETVSMMTALRAYEANVTALNATKGMALKALEIGQ
jgi:flagellar basal-body rod protein FlgC